MAVAAMLPSLFFFVVFPWLVRFVSTSRERTLPQRGALTHCESYPSFASSCGGGGVRLVGGAELIRGPRSTPLSERARLQGDRKTRAHFSREAQARVEITYSATPGS